jgi:hypothetical protein
MQFNAKTERRDVTIQGAKFTVPAPYAEGYTLNPNEASAMNQLLTENVRNNFAGRVKKVNDEDGDVAALQKELDVYVSGYEFGIRALGGIRSSDPVGKEAMEIARINVRKAIVRKGLVVKDVGAKKISELAADALEKHPEWREQAEEIVAAKAAVGESELDLDL